MNLPFVDRLDDRRRVGVTGEHDSRGVGIVLMDVGQQRGAVHIGHARIAHHQIDRLQRHDRQGLGPAGGEQHVIGLAAHQAPQAIKDGLLIIDQQHLGSMAQSRGHLLFHSVTSTETTIWPRLGRMRVRYCRGLAYRLYETAPIPGNDFVAPERKTGQRSMLTGLGSIIYVRQVIRERMPLL
jgi:hypothetical protein